jgi:hypothetical protein
MVQFNREQQTAGDPLHRWLIWLDKVKKPELAREVVDMDAGIAAKGKTNHGGVHTEKKKLRATPSYPTG